MGRRISRRIHEELVELIQSLYFDLDKFICEKCVDESFDKETYKMLCDIRDRLVNIGFNND